MLGGVHFPRERREREGGQARLGLAVWPGLWCRAGLHSELCLCRPRCQHSPECRAPILFFFVVCFLQIIALTWI